MAHMLYDDDFSPFFSDYLGSIFAVVFVSPSCFLPDVVYDRLYSDFPHWAVV